MLISLYRPRSPSFVPTPGSRVYLKPDRSSCVLCAPLSSSLLCSSSVCSSLPFKVLIPSVLFGQVQEDCISSLLRKASAIPTGRATVNEHYHADHRTVDLRRHPTFDLYTKSFLPLWISISVLYRWTLYTVLLPPTTTNLIAHTRQSKHHLDVSTYLNPLRKAGIGQFETSSSVAMRPAAFNSGNRVLTASQQNNPHPKWSTHNRRPLQWVNHLFSTITRNRAQTPNSMVTSHHTHTTHMVYQWPCYPLLQST